MERLERGVVDKHITREQENKKQLIQMMLNVYKTDLTVNSLTGKYIVLICEDLRRSQAQKFF